MSRMRISVDIHQLAELLTDIASDARDAARVEFGTSSDGVILGIAFGLKYTIQALNEASVFDMTADDKMAASAADRFCREQCPFSRLQEPGSHGACATCAIMPFTVGAARVAVERALES